MQELKIQRVKANSYRQCIICEGNKSGELYEICFRSNHIILCKNCIFKLNNMINDTLNIQTKFNPGDRVYHRNLKMYGTFAGYAWESEEECDVDFEIDGDIEQRHVSVNWLELVDEI